MKAPDDAAPDADLNVASDHSQNQNSSAPNTAVVHTDDVSINSIK